MEVRIQNTEKHPKLEGNYIIKRKKKKKKKKKKS